ncbi:MAG TPA: carboxypeptidase regulatory-like domain-containing protein [Patescibacteria group bacterium]|nr:carboxypeptidase regulatory-like domain-containing protein [Patescibacteria group bacterium]
MGNVTRNISEKMLAGCTFATALLFLLFVSIPTRAQTVGANLAGTVTDPSGAVIPKASINITNTGTGVTTHAVTNTSGFYIAHNLLPGTYQVTISAAGFRTGVTSGLVLTVGAQQVLNRTLNVGAAAQKVTVTAEAQDVQLQSAAISGVISTKSIVALPLNGRSWTDLALLQPGVNQISDMASVGTPDRIGRGLGVELTVAGQRPQTNNYLLDGISINDYSGQAPGSLLGGNLGVDAVQEFRVLTTDYSAEYGRSAGGIVTAITKSGTNQFHGSAYEYLRNSALDAQPYFNIGRNPPFRRNQFGASAGGRIIKNKAFVFGDFEGLRQFLSVSNQAQVPSLAARGIGTGPGGGPGLSTVACSGNPGDTCSNTSSVYPNGSETLTQYAANNGLAISNPDPVTGISEPVQQFIAAFYPHPNGAPFGDGNAAIYNFNGFQQVSEDYFTTRFDYHAGDKDTLSLVYLFDHNPGSQTDEFGNKLILNKTQRDVASLEETHLFGSNVVNIFRAGYSRIFAGAPAGVSAINPLAANTSYGFEPGNSAGGVLGVSELTDFSGGLSYEYPGTFTWNSLQGYDDIAVTKGINSITFGANIEHILEKEQSCGNCAGNFGFNDIPSFLTNNPNSFIGDVSGEINHYWEIIFGTFFQDSIQVRPNLTVTAGLRYEFDTVPVETRGHYGTLHSLTSNTEWNTGPLFFNPTLRDFEPRIGLAWDPFKTGKTSIRAGFGIYDVPILPANFRSALDSAYPWVIDYAVSNPAPGSFPTGAFNSATQALGHTANRASFIQQHPGRNYQMNWNVDVQRAIFPNTTVMLAYLGSRGVHDLLVTDDSSIVLPIEQVNAGGGYLWPFPAGSGTVLNPNWGRVSSSFWIGDNYYHAIEAALTQRTSHGLTAQISYTYGQSTDTSSGSTDGDQFLNGISSLWYFSEAIRKGPSDFNVPSNFTASLNYDLPSTRHLFTPLNWAASGWAVGSIITAENGGPFSPVFALGSDPLGMNSTDPWDFPNRVPGCNPIHGGVNYLNLSCFTLPQATPQIAALCTPFPGHPGTCMNLIGNSGRNSVQGPNIVSWDFSVHKDNYIRRISENFNIQFRAEFFNVLNHPQLSPPIDNMGVIDPSTGSAIPGAGVIDASIPNSQREIQFALRVDW